MYPLVPISVVQRVDGENGDYDVYADSHHHSRDGVA